MRVELEDGTSREIQSPVINTVMGAMAIQEAVENTKWVGRFGDPVAYARHIRKTPLSGVPAKAVIYQMAKGDQSVPNPNGTAILRAGDLADRATFYRHDLPPRFGLRGDPDTAEESMKCTQPTCAPAISGGS